MENKTDVRAGEGSQEIIVTRKFDLPVSLLFKAYEEAALFEQWMGTKVIKWDTQKYGAYAFETSHGGMVVFRAHGTIHEWIPDQQIVRTFEMENTPFPAQLEYLDFEKCSDDTSQLTMQIIFRSAAFRNQLLQMPFAQGLHMAHDRLQDIISRLK